MGQTLRLGWASVLLPLTIEYLTDHAFPAADSLFLGSICPFALRVRYLGSLRDAVNPGLRISRQQVDHRRH